MLLSAGAFWGSSRLAAGGQHLGLRRNIYPAGRLSTTIYCVQLGGDLL